MCLFTYLYLKTFVQRREKETIQKIRREGKEERQDANDLMGERCFLREMEGEKYKRKKEVKI